MPPATPPSIAATDKRVTELLELYGDPHASVADMLCDRHPADAASYILVEPDLSHRLVTYGELKDASERFAAALAGLGIQRGDRVATLLGKTVEHLIAIMSIWRLGAVHVPLFTAFAPPAISFRLHRSNAKVVICEDTQRAKLGTDDDDRAVGGPRIVVVGHPTHRTDLAFDELITSHEPGLAPVALGGDAPIVEMYTSGTTGQPKGVLARAVMLATSHTYMEFGLDVRPDDVYWNAGDPGWAYGLYLGVHGSWCTGVPSIWLRSGFSPETTLQVMSKFGVTNFTGAPTMYRAMRAFSAPLPTDLKLRCASAGGEPLTPEVNDWARQTLGVSVHDHYGQTEVGMLVNNHHHPAVRRPVKPGSMGQAMPGWTGVVLHEDRDDVAPPGVLGRIAFDVEASPLFTFTGYLDDLDKSASKFTSNRRWYLTGDSGRVDEDGYFSFVSRDDDVIIMAGYRIGPVDVESVLLTHPSVIEAAVIAAPDALRGEVLEAYIVLRQGTPGTDELADDLKTLVKTQFAAHAYPRHVHYVDSLPKTPSGKIQRYVLRQQRRAELESAKP